MLTMQCTFGASVFLTLCFIKSSQQGRARRRSRTLPLGNSAVYRNVWQSSKIWDNVPLRSEIIMGLRLAQSRFEALVLGAHLIGENLGLVYRWGSPKKFPELFLDRDPLTSTSAKSLPMLYIYMSILELDKLFLGTCVDLHLNSRNATSSR